VIRDLRSEIAEICGKAAFNVWSGLEIVSVEPGEVEISMPWRQEAGQYSGFLHAALIGGLIDTACGFAAVTLAGPVLAAHFSVNCLAPAVGVRFNARGIVIRPGRRQIFTRADLTAIGEAGDRKLVATGEVLLMKAN
jgi:acyl-coenzyme A thioesterase PaaI-like protein